MHSELPALALLAGGLATRMRPLTESIPKSLLLVDGEPFLAHQLRLLVKQGFREIVLCCGHLGEQLEAFAGDGSRFGCRIRYSYDGDMPLGTGGALRKALPLLGSSFFVMYGDSYLQAGPLRPWNMFRNSEAPALMCVYENDGRWDTSNVLFFDGKIQRYSKTNLMRTMLHIDYGMSIFRAETVLGWSSGFKFDLAAKLEELAESGQLTACEMDERFYEIGSLEGLHETEEVLKSLRAFELNHALQAVAGGAR